MKVELSPVHPHCRTKPLLKKREYYLRTGHFFVDQMSYDSYDQIRIGEPT